jgi:tetratricopeptide (TPR) repeat protein
MKNHPSRIAYERGLALQRQGKLGAARNCFAQALQADPSFAEAAAALEMVDAILGFEYRERLNV